MTFPTIVHQMAAERQAKLADLLKGAGVDADVSWVVQTGSTSDDAKAAASKGRIAVFVADSQTAGRGRNGNTWTTDAGAGLLLSIVLYPNVAPSRAPELTLPIGAAIAPALDHALAAVGRGETRVTVKWPNDVEIAKKKLAGVLVEAQTRGDKLASLVVGVGVNVVPSHGDAEVAARAVALTDPDHVTALDKATLAFELLRAIQGAVSAFEASGLAPFLADLRARDALKGDRVRAGDVEGQAAGVTDSGRLIVRTSTGDVEVQSGHVERLAS